TKKTILVKSIDNNSTLHIHSSNDTSLSLTEGTIGKNANIVHTGDNTDLRYVTVSLKADGDNSTKVQLNSIDVQNGHLNVTGLQVAADGSRSYAQLQANEIKASESLYIEADAVLGSIESDGNQNLSGGTISAGSITATTGTIYVDGAKVTAGTVSAGTNVEVSARLKATTVTAGESVTVDGGTLDAVTITAEDVALTTGVLTAGTVITDKVENGVLSVTSASSQGRAAAALLSGNVKVTATEIKADSLADGAEVEIDSSSAGVLSVKKLSNNDVSVGADFIMTNASTNSGISIGAKATVASGSLSADEVTLTYGYVIKAGKLTTDIILTDGAVYDGKGNSGVMMTNVQLAEMSVTADTIEAAEVSIEKGYTVNKAEVTADTTINAGRTEESRVILNNVGFSGPVKTSGYVELNSVKFKGGNQAFGGANGDAFRVDKDAQGVENVILKGDLKGKELTIDSMVLNA
ncbi:MAG: hypothetical protein IJY72_08365, partial [Akkermansia sp.]|nr:hypothetical protein [Akkermansia sp.]